LKYYLKKNFYLFVLSFLLVSSAFGRSNYIQNCSLTLSYDGRNLLPFDNIPASSASQTLRVYLQFSSLECRELVQYQENLDWVSTIGEGWSYVDIILTENTTPDSRNAIILIYGENQELRGSIEVNQSGNSSYTYYYSDSDGDGFGDYNSQPETSTTPISGKVTNNLDFCPFDSFTTNNGCEEPYEDINWVRSASYDILGNLIGSYKSYFDNLGKGIQTQTFDIKETRTWATQIMYDLQGRPAFQTLSAPITNKGVPLNFQFKNNFIKKNGGSLFQESDFTSGDIYNPSTIYPETNTLGWYYSTYNTNEPYQDITNRPYSRTIFSKLNPGAVKQTIGGNKINGEWKQGYSFSIPAAQEMYYVYGYNYFEVSPDIKNTYQGIETILTDSNKQINWLKATKSIVEDVHGNEAVVFTDTDGKTLAAARSGIPEKATDHRQYGVLSLIGEQKYIDIHIPKGCGGTASLLGGTNNYIIYDLKTELPNGDITKPGFYRIEYTGNKIFTNSSTLTYIDKVTKRIEPVENDAVGIRYKVNYYDFSVNYYNDSGLLTKTYQPIGFNFNGLIELTPEVVHYDRGKSTFKYNSLSQLLETTSPDEGESKFIYRKDGQIRFSQNTQQEDDEDISYTNYDEFGRPIESGVLILDNRGFLGTIQGSFFSNGDVDNSFISTHSISTKEQHFTEYDFLNNPSDLTNLNGLNQEYHNPSFLAGNVATTYNTDENQNKISQTWYSYDLYGRVKWIVQNIPTLGVKTIDYVYDPVTSQVTSVIYQKYNSAEYFEHKYTYNIAQELEKVETRTANNTTFIPHAEYSYYETGALKRTILADNLQEIDYIYNLAGQLKAINHPSLVQDSALIPEGRALNPNGKDLFGMSIDYYNGDYNRDSKFSMPSPFEQQFNGNIMGITWNTKIDGLITNPMQYSYKYNKNNWLKEAIFNANAQPNIIPTPSDVTLNSILTVPTTVEATNSITLKAGFEATGSFSAKIIPLANDDYRVSNITYDANGNIKSLNRNKNTETISGITSNKMDELTYDYYNETGKPNQLKRVEDNITQLTNAEDIKNQTTTENYIYNSIGQLIEDRENVTTSSPNDIIRYEYNASGLVTKVTKANLPIVQFLYNDKGFRTKKITYISNTNTVQTVTDYVLDASGSVLAIYENQQLQELPIYGASRLGIYKKPSNTSVYQLTDHLGNVRAVIAKQGTNAVALVGATDYYPFGMAMPLRIFGANGYRYQFQGQEKDIETGKEAFQLRLWDGRIGRWLTTDPAGQYASPYLGMGNNPINGIDPDGALYNPVYGSDGKRRGSTVEGNQGEAIIYDGNLDFSKMSVTQLTNNGGQTLSKYSINNPEFANSIAFMNVYIDLFDLPNRPDWDGKLTSAEVKSWRDKGNGKPLYIDKAKLNFKSSAFIVADFNGGNRQSVNFYNTFNIHSDNNNVIWRPSSDDYLGGMYGLGTVNVILLDPNKGIIDLENNANGWLDINDYASWRSLLVSGTDFPIGGFGVGSIHISLHKK